MTLDRYNQKSHLQNIENLFLMALSFFDENSHKNRVDFYLGRNLETISLKLTLSEELALIEKILDVMRQIEVLKIPGVTVLCRNSEEQIKLYFGDPEYHDLVFFEVLLIS